MTSVRHILSRDLPAVWRQRAEDLAPYAPPAAEAFRRAAAELEAQFVAEQDVALTLGVAASESGYSADHLRHMVAEGKIPNAGERRRPRIRRGDLPRKVATPTPAATEYDATADALSIERKRAERAARERAS